ncbi:MAG: signal peptide peptidase SppA [Bacteroidetes bacterium HGW-Bacteroidetes-14]|jgi:protease-4|nr:MAG: signal peptide peptidase SppA [Bacteroidetes bacterium HGW-Bacteroidetes-14]
MKNFLKIIAGTFIGSLLAMVLGFFILLGVIGSVASLSSSTKPVVPKSAVLSLNFSTKITEQSVEDPFAMFSPFGGTDSKTQGLLNFIETIDKAATDNAIKFIYMNVTNLNAGISHIEEVRSALVRFRESGKPIIAYADNFSQPAYYLATAADKIYMNPGGMAPLTGLSMSSLFFKDLLDKAGLEVQLIRHGKFKAAAEQFISNKMSPENREQIQSYIDAVWKTWVDDISAARGITPERINQMADNLELHSASKALEANIVDGLMYKDKLVDTLAKLFGVENEKDLKMISSTDYSKATYKVNLKEKNKIAIIYADGEIVMGKSDENIASDSFIEHISKVRKDSTIKAVVFRVNSPGGSAQSSDIIDRELALLREKKPVIISMGDYAASGGYWIAAKADKIITNNTTLTGSIGVFSMALNIQKGLKQHLHINAETVTTNRYSDLMSGYRALQDKEVAFIQAAIEEIYTDFINLVAEGREMTAEKVDEIAQGRIWSGLDAIKIGLADERGGLKEALNAAAGISGVESYRIVEYPVKKTQLDKLMEMISDGAYAAKAVSNPEILMENAYMYLKSESGVRHFARLPFNLTLQN